VQVQIPSREHQKYSVKSRLESESRAQVLNCGSCKPYRMQQK